MWKSIAIHVIMAVCQCRAFDVCCRGVTNMIANTLSEVISWISDVKGWLIGVLIYSYLDGCYDRALPDISWPIALWHMHTSITLRHGLGIRHEFVMKKQKCTELLKYLVFCLITCWAQQLILQLSCIVLSLDIIWDSLCQAGKLQQVFGDVAEMTML